jgi:DNA-binding beta-propeller fold protein YncE
MKFPSQIHRRITPLSFPWLVVFFAGIIAVFLPRIATSTLTSTQQSVPTAVAVRQITLATKDLVYDPLSQRIYASVPGSAGGIGNSITQIDPVPGTIGASVAIGSEPGKLAISDNSQYIYVALDTPGAVRRFDLTTQTAGLQFSLGSGPSGTFFVEDMGVMPGQPDSVAISRMYSGTAHAGVAIYDNGVARPTTTATFPVNNVIEFSATASRIYGYNNRSSGFDFSKLTVDASGVSIASTVPSLITGFDAGMVFQNGKIYSTRGKVVDPEASVQVGTYPGIAQSSLVLPDSSVNRGFHSHA